MNPYIFIELLGIVLGIFLLKFVPPFRKLFQNQENFTSAKNDRRDDVIDFIRGIAIIGIIIIHIDSYFFYFHPSDPELKITRLLSNYSRFCVPIFIFSSALFLNYKTGFSYWKPRINKLLFPYFAIATLGYFIKYNDFSNMDIWDFLSQILLGRVYEPYYFIPMIFQFYLFYFLFHKVIEKLKSWNLTIFVTITIFINMASNQYFALEHSEEVNKWQVLLCTNYLFFFVIGLVMKRKFLFKNELIELFSNNKSLSLLILTIVVYNSFITFFTFSDFFENSSRFVFYPFVTFILLTYLGVYLEKLANPSLKYMYQACVYLGKNSLTIFLLHPIVMHIMHKFDPYIMYGPLGAWITTLLINIFFPLLVWKSLFYPFYKLKLLYKTIKVNVSFLLFL